MKKLIPLLAIAAGLVLAGCNQNSSTNPAGGTSSSSSMTNSSTSTGTSATTNGAAQ